MKKITIVLLAVILLLAACAAPRQKLTPQANVALKTANVYYAQRDIEKAQVYYRDVLTSSPNHVLALTRMGDINLHKGETMADRSVEFNQAAYGFYKQAIQNYEAFTDLEDEDYVEIRNLKRRQEAAWTRVFRAAENLQTAGNSRDALATFEITAALDSTRFEPLYKMKEIYSRDLNDNVKSEQLMQRIFRIRPEDPAIMAELAGFYYNAGRYQDALQFFVRVRNINPRDINNLLNIAACHVELGELESAMIVTREILELEPNNIDALNNAQVLAGRMNDNPGRINYLKRLLLIRDNSEDYTTICSLLSQDRQYVDLITYAEKWYAYDSTSRYAVQFIILGAQNTSNRPLEQRYQTILRGMQ